MKQLRCFSAAVTGTTAMTLSSILFSIAEKKNFVEPVILATLIKRLGLPAGRKLQQISGWTIHYLVGLLFAELYAPLWEKIPGQPTVKSGLVLGGISGIAAILVWKFTLSIHPDPPTIDFARYAANLFVAHIIFGAFAAIGYSLPQ